eukprot:GILJ01005155.1.p1 GENE.GILJ01005155.1~~GILJ01005155.1.p1  ORF type:complete len:972 (-),score=201.07 GILJ01005155.1:109-2988(-)
MADKVRTENKRLTESAGGPAMLSKGRFQGDFVPQENPEYIRHRIAVYDEIMQQQKAQVAAMPHEKIVVTLPDGKQKEGVSWQTTPMDIAISIHKKLGEDAVVAKVRYTRRVGAVDEGVVNTGPEEEGEQTEKAELYDLTRPLEGDCELQLLKFDDAEGKMVFWHSSAHMLGEALECKFGCHLCIGPPVENGFYYDAFIGSHPISQEHFPQIEEKATAIAAEKQAFERIVLSKEQALEMFKHNPFKTEIISTKIPDGGKTTAYRCGPLIDLCRGPHVPHTGRVKAFAVTKNSAAYWLGKAENDTLQRVYGISFPDKKQLTEYKHLMEEAERRDHRNVGKHQHLFFFHNLSPGSAFFLPHGARIYNRLVEFIRKQYRVRGFDEVITPNMYSCDLFKVSGHYQNYKEHMFLLDVEKAEFGMKPMNCPGHCLMFDHTVRSYRELPIRMADFGVLHRNEFSGALSGLTRVRRFQQDDAHIFCAPEQIMEEVKNSLDFLQYVYGIFGFEFELQLSTKPAKALGTAEQWEQAEKALAAALDAFGKPWKINPADGAFYGPKIDIKLWDALKRQHQCGTIQLDFQLPIRFNLQFRNKESEHEEASSEPAQSPAQSPTQSPPHESGHQHGAAAPGTAVELKPGHSRPVIIHRAVLGSLERMIAVLTEHCGGKWPFWVSPRQIIIVPISEKFEEYALKIKQRVHQEGYYVDADVSNGTLNKKIRNAQLAQYNYICVVGQEELESGTVDVRTRDNERHGKFTIPDFLVHVKKEEPPMSQYDFDNWQKSYLAPGESVPSGAVLKNPDHAAIAKAGKGGKEKKADSQAKQVKGESKPKQAKEPKTDAKEEKKPVQAGVESKQSKPQPKSQPKQPQATKPTPTPTPAAAVAGSVPVPAGHHAPVDTSSFVSNGSALNDFLKTRSYVGGLGFTLSKEDVQLFRRMSGAPDAAQHPHAARWYKHLSRLPEDALERV